MVLSTGLRRWFMSTVVGSLLLSYSSSKVINRFVTQQNTTILFKYPYNAQLLSISLTVTGDCVHNNSSLYRRQCGQNKRVIKESEHILLRSFSIQSQNRSNPILYRLSPITSTPASIYHPSLYRDSADNHRASHICPCSRYYPGGSICTRGG